MPNHITNRLEIVGNDNQVKEVRTFLKGENNKDGNEVYLDFNNIIEMPSGLKVEFEPEVDLTRQLLFEQSFYYDGLLRKEAWKKFTEFKRCNQDEYIESAIQVQDNIQKTGHAFGFSWIRENWGTESNAYSQSLETENVISFKTDGVPATKMIKVLSLKFAGVDFIHQYTTEVEYGGNLPF